MPFFGYESAETQVQGDAMQSSMSESWEVLSVSARGTLPSWYGTACS